MQPAGVMLADTLLLARGYFWKFLMLSHYLNPLLACKYQNAAVPQQEAGGWLGRRKLRKPGWVSGARSPHGSINNDSHRLTLRSKEMLLGSTRHPQCCWKPQQHELGGLQLLLRLVSFSQGHPGTTGRKIKNKNRQQSLKTWGSCWPCP